MNATDATLPRPPALRLAAMAGRLWLRRRAAAALSAILAAEAERMPLWWAVALGCGLVAYFCQAAEPSPLWLLLAPLLLAPALWLGLRGHGGAGWLLGLAGMAALGFGWGAWSAARQPPPLSLPSRAVVVTGQVAAVEQLPGGLRVTLAGAVWEEGAAPAARQIRVRLRAQDPLRPMPGETLRLRALLRPPPAPAYPGAWDFQREAFFSGLGGSGFAIGPAERLSPPAEQDAVADPFATLRARLERHVLDSIPGAAGAVSAAMFTGGQGAIPAEAMQAMRDSGLAHLLSVSGLHIAIVMGLGFTVVRLLVALVPPLALRVDGKRLAAPASLALGFGYLLLTGWQVPMLRSFGMAALVTLGILLGRRALSLRALALAAVVVMLLAPQALLGPSFQMSFAAVMVLIAGGEALAPLLSRGRRLAPWWARPLLLLFGLLASSLLAGLATLPFGLHHFGRLQLYGVAANLVAVPLTSFLVMPAGMLAMLLWPLGLEQAPLHLMGWAVEGVLWVARGVASWPGAAMTTLPIPSWGLGVTAFGLVWLCLWRSGLRWLGVPLLALGLGSAAWVRPPDILVSADARLIGFRTEEGLALHRSGSVSAFLRESWLRGWGEEDAPAPEAAKLPGLSCTARECRFQPWPEGPAALLLRPVKPQRGGQAAPLWASAACGRAALLLAAEPIRGRCEASAVIDRFSVWRDGAHAAWLRPGGVVVVSDRAWRGARPWVPPRPAPRAAPGQAPEQTSVQTSGQAPGQVQAGEAAALSSGAADPPDAPEP
ncbi:ComEC family competence protein [Roseomonas sp. GC11]|uniref:ComEC/Rec2 family competence protein n=1 Tax=Roseomonas sp. GC11 TaxID=2950546 RepID=UPI00210F0E57|nr:ComEC/Rec2 family competence protein [Roseomonas sp. GC11]MCQ4161918.1 ComEC family competence protein [Roseomonas sp. GC11]